jgi:four helix bundle protein
MDTLEARGKKQEARKICSFTDLEAWREAHRLYILIYRATKQFPKDEQLGLTNQIRRASLSVTSNIAEGFSRATNADKIHFYIMAHGSLTETQNQLLAARDVEILPASEFQPLAEQAVQAHKLLTGLINATKKRAS